MPCDTIQLNSVSFDITKLNPKLLAKALEAIGAKVVQINKSLVTFVKNNERYTIANGKLTTRAFNGGEVADDVRKAYSAQVVQLAAYQNGWTVQQTGPFAYNVLRS